ncbi:glutaredoxin [bacterium]|nr:glutaredoxin [bacterium]
MSMLELFTLEKCPYCLKVKKFMDEKSIDYRNLDISDKDNEYSLIKLGGKRQVPFLVDNDRNIQLYESSDIIEYLKTII